MALTCVDVFSHRSLEKEFAVQEIRNIWLNFARKAGANSDFKYLSDLILKKMTPTERQELIASAKSYRRKIYDNLVERGLNQSSAQRLSQTAYSRRVLELLFMDKVQIKNIDTRNFGSRLELVDSPLHTGLDFSSLKKMFSSLEASWPHLIKRMVYYSSGSLLKVKDILFIAGGRFRESYYWDSFFGAMGLVKTGRTDLVIRQMKKFVDDINNYGLIPNGNRSYYLTRSQPPVVSLMAKLIFDQTRNFKVEQRQEVDHFLKNEVLNALEKDYHQFWMSQRYDTETGLNFYSDKLNIPRPEAHSKDNSQNLALSERDVRAEAESGQDFTDLFAGQASRTLSVQLNAFMLAYETNLSWLHSLRGNKSQADFYQQKVEDRKQNINLYLRDNDGLYRNYNLETQSLNEGLSGEIFSLLFVKALSPKQAQTLIPLALQHLEKNGGIAASTFHKSHKQWDGRYGWAPFQMMAVQGLLNYGHKQAAQRLMFKWLQTQTNIFNSTGQFYEKADVETMQLPSVDNSKYPNQVGFLWTNSSIVWMLDLLGYSFKAH